MVASQRLTFPLSIRKTVVADSVIEKKEIAEEDSNYKRSNRTITYDPIRAIELRSKPDSSSHLLQFDGVRSGWPKLMRGELCRVTTHFSPSINCCSVLYLFSWLHVASTCVWLGFASLKWVPSFPPVKQQVRLWVSEKRIKRISVGALRIWAFDRRQLPMAALNVVRRSSRPHSWIQQGRRKPRLEGRKRTSGGWAIPIHAMEANWCDRDGSGRWWCRQASIRRWWKIARHRSSSVSVRLRPISAVRSSAGGGKVRHLEQRSDEGGPFLRSRIRPWRRLPGADRSPPLHRFLTDGYRQPKYCLSSHSRLTFPLSNLKAIAISIDFGVRGD